MALTARRKEADWGELGPAMRALPKNKWRLYVEFYLLEKPGYGAQVNAAMRAGFFTEKTTPMNRARIASRLHHDERIQAALVEEGRKIVRGCAPDAAKALLELVRDKDHKDHARALGMVLDRVDPMVTRTDMNVVHRSSIPTPRPWRNCGRCGRSIPRTPRCWRCSGSTASIGCWRWSGARMRLR